MPPPKSDALQGLARSRQTDAGVSVRGRRAGAPCGCLPFASSTAITFSLPPRSFSCFRCRPRQQVAMLRPAIFASALLLTVCATATALLSYVADVSKLQIQCRSNRLGNTARQTSCRSPNDRDVTPRESQVEKGGAIQAANVFRPSSRWIQGTLAILANARCCFWAVR
ncbi:hypothetical protein Mal33_24590 [Rosistilla oblonga]|uniref:Uncharacterized protein n=1 Tax=Rosistilla oblonga TaxID=2527990 RepID=A0A518ITQ4_9BACT|nr:hypothetical protein Mal33_24590 [Rosistilla oblonga]